MILFNLLLSVSLSARLGAGPVEVLPWLHRPNRLSSVLHDTSPDMIRNAQPDTNIPPLLGPSLRYGIDTTVSPCLDFYQYVNGEWRSRTVLRGTSGRQPQKVSAFSDAYARIRQRLQVILDSARTIVATTTDPTLRVLGLFYQSCLVSETLERIPGQDTPSQSLPRDSTRSTQCLQRTIDNLGGALGQAFARELLTAAIRLRMEHLLEAIRTAVMARMERNPWMNPEEKTRVLERLQKLHLRIGMPRELVDYQSLTLSETDYLQNKRAIVNFANRQWAQSIGGNIREQWKMGLLTLNASYRSSEHAIEVPAAMFMPPFFDGAEEDAVNFAGIGMVIGHEIFHSLSGQLSTLEHSAMKTQIEQFKSMNSSLGTLDGWGTNGERTYGEDIADLGGVLVAYEAWKATLKADNTTPATLIDGWTPDQRFFVALGRIWRSKWRSSGGNRDVHAAPFARVNAMVMQSPAFAKAFGCQDTDPMVLPADKRALIW